jgi:hypothetical protein
MGKKSNGALRKARHAETIIRKGLDQMQPDPYATSYGTDGTTLRSLYRKG